MPRSSTDARDKNTAAGFYAMDKTGQRYGANDLVAIAVYNPHVESKASIIYGEVLEILTHDEDGTPYSHASHRDPTARTMAPRDGGFAVRIQPIVESSATATLLGENPQPRVFTTVNNIVAVKHKTVADLRAAARLYADE
jgi:hypothetical protein